MHMGVRRSTALKFGKLEGQAPGCRATPPPPDGEISGFGVCVQHTLVKFTKSNFLIHLVMIDNYKGGVVNVDLPNLPIVATQMWP